MTPYRKSGAAAPTRYYAWEAAGLRWLAAAGGMPVARVLDVGADHLTLERLESVAPSRPAARRFGEDLAITHQAGAPAYGSGPEGWAGDGYFGPLARPLPMSLRPSRSWGEFWAEQRVLPLVALARDQGYLAAADVAMAERIAARLVGDQFSAPDGMPARLHGDLWSGNLMWTAAGVVAIDPAAHGGHPETDLAMLALFGAPYLDEITAGYQAVGTLAPGWRDRVGVHQLHPVLAHVVLFGSGYVPMARDLLRRYC